MPTVPQTTQRYVLEGRVVTMGPKGVLDDGAIYIDGERIVDVLPTGAPAPVGHKDAPRIRTGDTLYPGLIELHNHLSYNAMPLWDVPQAYTNNGQWKNHPDYRRLITKPSQTLGRSERVMEALVRYVECRTLLGGTTSSQGITLASAGQLRKLYQGVVRNVEMPADEALPRAGTKIANPSSSGAEQYLARLRTNTCYLQHMSEGIDDTARGWFVRLRIDAQRWALHDSFCGIHCTALERRDLELIREHGGSMVWSPLSNYLLYGDTVDLRAASASGIPMALGCDWAPSGSKNLLGELKVAWLASKRADEVFSAEELIEMVSINPARMLKWDHALGSLEAGKLADVIAVNGQQEDPYEQLVSARETALTLVVIGGVARVGQVRLMNQFGGGTETIRVGRSERVLNLEQPTTHPLVRELSLTEATTRLERAMAELPQLAETLDRASEGGVFSGSLDPASGDRWQVAFEFDDEEPDLTGAALPLADFVQPMQLDPITVADDREFLPRLGQARNLPDFVKDGLWPLYGQHKRLPSEASAVQERSALQEFVELKGFLSSAGGLSKAQRLVIVEQALGLLERHYVHLPLGHIRIFTFNIRHPDAFVDEFVRLLEGLPQDGLIVDVRGNGGGHIHAAERLLQTLTDRRIEPQRTQFVSTPENLALCRAHAPSERIAGLDLGLWTSSLSDALRTGADFSTNELLAQRAFVGVSGQRLQGFLQKAGLSRSYVMLNTFLFGIHGQFDSQMRTVSREAPIVEYRNRLFDHVAEHNPLQAIVATGSAARHAVQHWPGKNVPVFGIQHPSARDSEALLASWSAALTGLIEVVDPDDGVVADPSPYGTEFREQDRIDIPRFDLPFGLPAWQGTAAGVSRRPSDTEILWTAPDPIAP